MASIRISSRTGFLLVCIGLALTSSVQAKEQSKAHGLGDEELLDVVECVYRYQFEHNASGAQQKARAYFLEYFGDDPPVALLARFAGHRPHVDKASRFEMGKGLLFKVNAVKRADETRLHVEGGYFEGGLSASGCRYVVEKGDDGRWMVTKKVMRWIS